MDMDWVHAKDLLLIGMAGTFCTFLGTQIRELIRSIETLNIKIAQVLERLDGHEKRITHIEDKI